MKKPIALTLLLVVLPLPLLIPGAVRLVGGVSNYRRIVLWGLPAAAALIAAAFSLGRRRGLLFAGTSSLRRMLPWCALALVVDYGFLGAGDLLGWITFTYGDQQLMGHPFRAMAWGLPVCLAIGVFGWEWALRRTLLVSWAGHVPRSVALAISCFAGLALTAPSIVPGLVVPDPAFVAASFLVVACREVSFGLVFLSGAGLPAAGLYRGLLIYVDAFLIADWYGLWFPLANFTTSEPEFYLVRVATAVLATGIVAAALRWNARRQATAALPTGSLSAPPRSASS